MSAGYAVTAADVNNRAGSLVVALWTQLDAVHQFKLWLDDSAHNDTYLNGLGITGSSASGDVATLRNGIADLGGSTGLWAVAHGTYDPPAVNNFFFNAKLLAGINYAG
jgi:hypothetical protein